MEGRRSEGIDGEDKTRVERSIYPLVPNHVGSLEALEGRSCLTSRSVVLIGRKPGNPQTPEYTTAAASRVHTPSTPSSARSPREATHSPCSTRDTTDESGTAVPRGSEEEAVATGANAFTPVITVSQPLTEEQKRKSTD